MIFLRSPSGCGPAWASCREQLKVQTGLTSRWLNDCHSNEERPDEPPTHSIIHCRYHHQYHDCGICYDSLQPRELEASRRTAQRHAMCSLLASCCLPLPASVCCCCLPLPVSACCCCVARPALCSLGCLLAAPGSSSRHDSSSSRQHQIRQQQQLALIPAGPA